MGLTGLFLLNGCIVIGNRGDAQDKVSLGQQLVDLQKARDTGAITEAEYETQRCRLLNEKR